MMAKMGRPPIEKYKSPDQMIKAYKVHHTLKGTAKACNVDVKTLKRVLRNNGIEIHKPTLVEIQKYGSMSRREGCFAKWLKHNQGVKLPPNMKEIAKITGCTYDAVKSYFRYRKSLIKDVLKRLPDIRDLDATLIDTLGFYVSTKSIRDYRYRINKFSCDVYIVADLAEGGTTEIHIENLSEFEEKIKAVLS
jgi:hypothetical protein